jgi:hypothetical protein
MTCQGCRKRTSYGARVGARPKYARYCPPCRSAQRRKRTKWISTPRLDDEIRRCYLARLRSKTVPGLLAPAERIGWPKWAFVKRAVRAGVKEQQFCRFGGQQWRWCLGSGHTGARLTNRTCSP